jgi:hypothetical protein
MPEATPRESAGSRLFADLRSARWMYVKALLFLVIGLVASAELLLGACNWRTATLLGLAIWSFCRLYYFAFYVIEKYIDPSYRFSGLGSVLRHLWARRSGARR